MKLKLLATASQHTANFKVMAAEYRFAAEGLEMLDSQIKTPLLNIGKSLNEEELTELGKAFAPHMDKKGLSFITAVMSECEKSTVLMETAQKLVADLKNSNKKESSFGKRSGFGAELLEGVTDFLTGDNQINLKDGFLKNMLNFVSSKITRIGFLILIAAGIYMIMAFGEAVLVGRGEGFTGYLMENGFVGMDEITTWFKSGTSVTILGIAMKALAAVMDTFGFTSTETRALDGDRQITTKSVL